MPASSFARSRSISLLVITVCFVCYVSSLPVSSAGLENHQTFICTRQQHYTTAPTQGWTWNYGRGTFDIIWSCIFTIFLCSWSVLCINLPAESDTPWEIFWRRLYLTGMAIAGPEVVFQLALGQRLSARRSVKEFAELGFKDWTLSHAFFADMGGFVLHTPDFQQFPINAGQLWYLVGRNYLPYPKITKEEIKDRNKVDVLLRIITLLQTQWFVVNFVVRIAQGLGNTTLELTTVGFIFCTIGTHICWSHKPADVNVPVVLRCETPISLILTAAGRSLDPEGQTPLDFASRHDWAWSEWWNSTFKAIHRFTGLRFYQSSRPIKRMPNDVWPFQPSIGVVGVTLFDIAYAAIYVGGWNMWFNTKIERTLWRVSTLAILFSFVVFLALYATLFIPKPVDWVPFHRKNQGCFAHRYSRDRGRTGTNQPHFRLPKSIAVGFTVVAAVYFFARCCVLLDSVIALRRLPASMYETVNWTGFLPHV